MCSVKNRCVVNTVDLFASLLCDLSANIDLVRMFVLHGTHQRASWQARQRDEFIFIHFSDVCEDCGHMIAIHKYSFSADDQFQV